MSSFSNTSRSLEKDISDGYNTLDNKVRSATRSRSTFGSETSVF